MLFRKISLFFLILPSQAYSPNHWLNFLPCHCDWFCDCIIILFISSIISYSFWCLTPSQPAPFSFVCCLIHISSFISWDPYLPKSYWEFEAQCFLKLIWFPVEIFSKQVLFWKPQVPDSLSFMLYNVSLASPIALKILIILEKGELYSALVNACNHGEIVSVRILHLHFRLED